MKLKIIVGVIIVLLIAFLFVFVFMGSRGHTDETSWGSWYQEYEIKYSDGTSVPLSLYHSGKQVDSLQYSLSAKVNMGYGQALIDLSDYQVDILVNNEVLDTVFFNEQMTVESVDGRVELISEILFLDVIRSLSNGTYAVSFVPSGSILIDSDQAELPSSASVMVRVGSINNEEPPDEEPDPDGNGVSFESEVVWS